MFDGIPDPASCGELTPAEMVTAIRLCHRGEAGLAGRKWAFTHMLLRYREGEAAAVEQTWAHDTWAAVKDEIGAAMGLSPRRASGQIRIAEALAERLPEVAGLLAHGIITAKVAATIVYRTDYVATEAHGAVDAEFARRAGGYGTLSDTELDLTIDAVIEEHDPNACRRFREAAKNLDVQFGKLDDATGTRSMFGRILATDGDVALTVLNALADTVCTGDPRSRGQLRAAAFGAFFQGFDRLVCRCADPDCAAATIPSKVGKVVVHILAEQATLAAALAEAAAYAEGQRTERAQQRQQPAREAVATQPTAAEPAAPKPAAPEPAASESAATDDEPWWATLTSAATQPAAAADAATTEPDHAAPAEPVVPKPVTPEPAEPNTADDDEPWWTTWTSANPTSAPAKPADPAAHPEPAEPSPTENPTSTDSGDDAAPPTDTTSTEPPPTAQCAAPAQSHPATDSTPDADETHCPTAHPAPRHRADIPAPPAEATSSTRPRTAHCAAPTPPVRPALTTDGTLVPTPLLAELIRTGATLTTLALPDEPPEPGYRPSRRLRRNVQCRDLLCRFPGCNRRAEYADLDHTIPDADGGATHPSNTKVLCREHHLAKTFRGGPTGWRDEQLPDGTLIWTAPTGHSYLTEPTSILIFPDWDTTTAPLPPPKPRKRRTSDPGLTMPKRTRTRAQDRAQHIKAERDYNATQRALNNAELERPPPL